MQRLLVSIVGALWLLLAPLTAVADEIPAKARVYFQNGVELLQAEPPNYQDAYYQFKKAYELSHSWKVLGNLGLCALKLERDGEALKYYADYFESGGDNIDPDERIAIEREMLLVQGNMATLKITSDEDKVSLVDKRVGSSAPPQAYLLEGGVIVLGVRAGSHTITAEGSGKKLKLEVTLRPGQTYEYKFQFGGEAPAITQTTAAEPDSEGAPASTPASSAPADDSSKGPPAQPEEASGSTHRTIGYIVGGLGVLTVGAAVFTGLKAKDEETKAQDRLAEPNSGCVDMRCPLALESEFDDADSMATVTNVLFIAGGVLTATGVTLVVVGAPSSEASSSQARLQLTPAGAGFMAHGVF